MAIEYGHEKVQYSYEKWWNELIQDARELKEFKEHFNIPYSYISIRIEEPEEKIKGFFALNSDSAPGKEYEKYYEYNDVERKIRKLFNEGKKRSHYPLNPYKIWEDLIESATKLSKFQKQFNIPCSYISIKTGESEEKIRNFFALNPNAGVKAEFPDREEYPQYETIEKKVTELFQQEKKCLKFSLLDDNEFYQLHINLMNEFKISNKELAKLIKETIIDSETESHKQQSDMLKREIERYDRWMKDGKPVTKTVGCKYVTENISLTPKEKKKIKILYDNAKDKLELLKKDEPPKEKKRHMKLRNINSNNVTQANFTFNVYQQKAILEVYFEKCVNARGYLLPEHLGTGIRLAYYLRGSILTIKKEGRITNSNTYGGIKKIIRWTHGKKEYDFGETADKAETYDKVYEFLSAHKRVFFYETYIDHKTMIFQKIIDSPKEVQEQLSDWLNSELSIDFPKPKPQKRRVDFWELDRYRNHYQALSEYFDIMAKPDIMEDISKLSKKQVYRILYDMCVEFNKNASYPHERVEFSYELVEEVCKLIKLKEHEWIWKVYISNYYFDHKEIDSIAKYIETMSIEENDEKIEKEI